MNIDEFLDRRYWEDPTVTQQNRLPAHTPLFSFASLQQARQKDHMGRRQLLDGDWRFFLFERPEYVQQEVVEQTFDDSLWPTIKVPGNWECQGFGQPRYTNKKYPFPCAPPLVPACNPIGVYRHSFVWEEEEVRHLRVCFDGFASALALWCNGRYVGYAQDGRTGSEFELSQYIQRGENSLVAVVLRWCDGSYLEDQDMWSLSGLYRSVYLITKPTSYIKDFKVVQHLCESYQNASLDIHVQIQSQWDCPLYIEVAIFSEQSEQTPIKTVTASINNVGSALLQMVIPSPMLWSDEEPHLYQLVLQLSDAKKHCLEFEHCALGFRCIEVKNGLVCLNGQPVLFRGVNRHEFHPQRGYSLTREDMLLDIKLLKQGNFNAVRMAHYPNDPAWYKLCDEFGIFLIDEANIETHGMQPTHDLLDDPAWHDAYLQRVIRMVERDKNHASVLIWSLGNEAGYGQIHHTLYDWIKASDPQRLVQYEGGGSNTSVTDILCPMYARVDEDCLDETGLKPRLEKWITQPQEYRPLILCEYAHAMGNSLGGFSRYWRAFRHHARLQGGFIWDWQDQGLAHPDFPEGSWAYGGDFGDKEHDAQFCINGLLFPNRKVHPAYYEAQYHQQYFWGKLISETPRILRVYSEYQHKHQHVCLHWQYWKSTQCIQEHRCTLEIAPHCHVDVELPHFDESHQANDARYMNFFIRTLQDNNWSSVGFCLARWQIILAPSSPGKEYLPTPKPCLAPWQSREGCFALDNLQVDFCTRTGRLQRIHKANKCLLDGAFYEQFIRAPVDNDYGICEQHGPSHPQAWLLHWQTAGLDQLTQSCREFSSQIRVEGGLSVESQHVWTYAQRDVIKTRWRYDFWNSDCCDVCVDFILDRSLLPVARIGLTTQLPFVEKISWQGRGPHENYPDRCDSAFVGCYTQPIEDLHTPYIFPSENGLRTQTQILNCGELIVRSEAAFCFSIQPYSLQQLWQARHPHELKKEDKLTLCLDIRHAGVGGDDAWSASIHPDFQVKDEHIQWVFRLEFGALASANKANRSLESQGAPLTSQTERQSQ